MSSLQKSLMKDKLPPIPHGGSSAIGGGLKRLPGRRRDYSPIPWSRYFDDKKDVQVNGNTFRVYIKKSKVAEDDMPPSSDPVPVLVLLHGGGFSALTWALFAESITNQVMCQVIAIDLRGHGDTNTTDDLNLSADTLSSDVIGVIDTLLFEDGQTESQPIILIGHSMGGAVAVHTATKIVETGPGNLGDMGYEDVDVENTAIEKKPTTETLARVTLNLCGVAVIDVVEGTAMDALAGMQSLLRSRPQKFPSLPNAIDVRSGQVRNVESARVSMPGQIKNISTGATATNDIDELLSECNKRGSSSTDLVTSGLGIAESRRNDSISEEEEEIEDGEKSQDVFKKPLQNFNAASSNSGYAWRIDLAKTESFWPGWFKGLSSAFLILPMPKLLLLAGIDRLDKALTVGQMQGKFQMQVLPKCGHAVHEDVPDKVSDVVATFLVRHKFATPTANFNRSVVMAPTPNWSELINH
ncbi:hypothetical protein J437_LFUL008405 [Ladona fulva]|uniref:Protein phosphatase methylesterase 1 n=1 Tax=Ladona fulva TaxID=123851 RepID=A0A8K0K7V6_LADFU|nr:hypothetical protein J437_LFUL008405 [Ladona fulva]